MSWRDLVEEEKDWRQVAVPAVAEKPQRRILRDRREVLDPEAPAPAPVETNVRGIGRGAVVTAQRKAAEAAAAAPKYTPTPKGKYEDEWKRLLGDQGSISTAPPPAASLSTIGRGFANTFKAMNESAEQAIQDAVGVPSFVTEGRKVAENSQLRDLRQAFARQDTDRPQFSNPLAQGLYGAVESTLMQMPGIAASIAAGNPAPALAWAGATTGAQGYGKYRARGGTPGEAALGGAGEGVVEIATELIPMGTFLRAFGKEGGEAFLKQALKSTAQDMPGEQIATLAQDAIDTAIANPDKTWDEYVKERPEAALVTAIATLGQGAIMTGGGYVAKTATDRLTNRGTQAPSMREQAVEQAIASVTPEDEASPISTQDIIDGRTEIALNQASEEADKALGASGLPGVGKRVTVTMPDGSTQSGTMKDVFQAEDGGGVVVDLDNGRSHRWYTDDLTAAGVTITEDTSLGAQFDTAMQDVSSAFDSALGPMDDTAAPDWRDAAELVSGSETTSTVSGPRTAPSSRPSPVEDGGAIVRSIFGDKARITSTYRGPNHPLTLKNPKSWHSKSHAAVDMAPIAGMTFDQAKAQIEAQGYSLLEAIDEVNHPSGHATGPHWHFVIGKGGQSSSEVPGAAPSLADATTQTPADSATEPDPLAETQAPEAAAVESGRAEALLEPAQDLAGEKIDNEWVKFKPESGTLEIPRDEMPQIKAENRGAMVNFLNARGIAHQEDTVPATSLRPTQAEFSTAKVQKAKEYEGGDRAILVSQDGHVVDGHHQWLAARDKGEDIRVIRLDAPVREIINTVGDMPSTATADGADVPKVDAEPAPVRTASAGEMVTTPEPQETAPSAPQGAISVTTPRPARVEATGTGKSVAIPKAPSTSAASRNDTAVTTTGREIPVEYAAVDLKNLITSHNQDGAVNSSFPADLQPRDRSRGTSSAQIADIAARLNPRLLGQSPKASDGAPIVSPEGIVESGNGRTLAIGRAYSLGGEKAEAYRQFVADQGFDVTGMDQPVLVRIRRGEMAPADVQAFTREANQRDTAGFSVTEMAVSDAAALPGSVLDLYRGGDIDTAGNREFVRRFMEALVPATERANMVAADGAISQDAIRRINAAMLQRAYSNEQLVAKINESADTNVKAIGGALSDVSAAWAKMREAARTGQIDPAMDITPYLNEAVELVDRARRDGAKVADLVNQADIFSGKTVNPVTEAILRIVMFRNSGLTQPTGRAKMAERLNWYVDQAMLSSADPGLFGAAEQTTPSEILTTAQGRFDERQEDQSDLLTQRPDAGFGNGRSEGGGKGNGDGGGVSAQPVQEGAVDERLTPAEEARDPYTPKADEPFDATQGNASPERPSGEGRAVSVDERITAVAERWQQPRAYVQNVLRAAVQRSGNSVEEELSRLEAELDRRNQGTAAPAREASTGSKPSQEPIEDFGEKLEGARKDTWQAYARRLEDAKQEDVQAVPLSKSWPEPDYQKLIDDGADPYVVASMRAMRDAIPTKPRSYGVVAWGKQVEALRAYAEGLLNGNIDAEAHRKKLEGEFARSLRDLQGSIDLYLEFGHDRSFKGITFGSNHYSLYRDEQNVTKWAIEQKAKATAFSNWPRELAVGDTREEVITKFREVLANGGLDKKKSEIVRFDIYSRRGQPGFWVGKKIGNDYADLKRFDTAKEARAYKISDEGYDELVRLLGTYKDIPPERKETNSPRIGINHRNGADVTPEQFSVAFGFRGVQFGNYVEGARRQEDLNEAYDALMDLAGVLNVPAKALSLNGSLGLAFGARGKGGKGAAAAHYERGEVVINLTKRSGAGSLAHEWWHSLDNYFSRSRNDPLSYMSNKPWERGEGVRPEMVKAFANVMAAIKSTGLKERSKNLDKRRTKEYWSTDVEMSARVFENYVIAKLADEQHSNDYLANIVSEEAFSLEEGYPYLKAGEIPAVRGAFDAFFRAVETEQTDKGVRLYSIADGGLFDDPAQPERTMTQAQRSELEARKMQGMSRKGGQKPIADQEGGLFSAERDQGSLFRRSAPEGAGVDFKALQARLESYGIARKVALRITDGLQNGAAGSYFERLIEIAVNTEQDAAFTLDHEVIHALRDLGVFNQSEWAILAAKAKRDPHLMRSIRQRYAKLDAEAQSEEAVADMFARWQRGDYTAKGTINRIFAKVRDLFEALRNAYAGLGMRSGADVMTDVASGEIGNRQTVLVARGGSGAASSQEGGSRQSVPQEDTFAAEWLSELASVEDIFQHPTSSAQSVPAAISEIVPDARYRGAAKEGELQVHNFMSGRMRPFSVYQSDNEVWIDVSRLLPGDRGSAIYAAVAEYAFNSKKKFIGDPAGLSDVALRRRTDAMLSSALKHGTTDHLEPHPYQLEGNPKLGVPPLKWNEGDTLGNVQSLIEVSLASIESDVPNLRNVQVRFDFATGTFRNSLGREVTDADFWRESDTARRNGSKAAGRATLKRAILLASLVRAQSSSRPGLLELVLRERGQAVLGPALRDTFYSIPEALPDAGHNFDDPAAKVSRQARSMLASIGGPTLDSIRDKTDNWRVYVQDKMLPVRRLQEGIAGALGRDLSNSENPYLAEELMTGRAGARLEKLAEEIIDPLFQAMHENSVSVDELETYLYARHAQERNAHVGEINPEFAPGEGSGMTDVEAMAILSRVKKSGKQDVMDALAAYVDRMLKDAVQTRVAAGLLSQEEADAWGAAYQHYVPLRGKREVEGDVSSQQERVQTMTGQSVRGKESKRAFGRRSQPDSILAYSILQAEEAIIRAEKNVTAKAFVSLARAYPDPAFWTENKVETRQRINPTTGLAERYVVNQLTAEDAPYTVTAKIDGKEVRVTMNRDNTRALRVAEAMRNLEDPQFNGLMKFASAINRGFSAINTRYSPAFVITNALRDLQTMAVVGQRFDVPGFARRVARDYFGAMFAPRKGDSEWAKWRREWEMSGGRIYYNQSQDLGDIKRELEKRTKRLASPNQFAHAWVKTFDALEAVNDSVERAIRLSVYKNAREAGKTRPEAASMARNVTVNFTRKGRWGPAMNAFYAFFNAAVQGNSNLVMAAAKSKKVRAAMAGFIVAGFLSDLLNSMFAGDDDDGENLWDKVPQWEKSRNVMLMLGGPDGGAIKFPLAYGLNALFGLGRNASAMMRGALSPGEATMQSALEFAEAFNPLGGGGSWLNIIAPTALDPFVDTAVTNKDFTDRPIQPEQNPFQPDVTPSSNYWPGVSAWAKDVAKGVNEATGGDDVLPGALSVSPNVVQYFGGYVTGGAGRFIGDVADLVMSPFDPETEIEVGDVPFVKTLYRVKSFSADKSTYYDRVHEVEEVLNRAKQYMDRGDKDGFVAYAEGNIPILEMEDATKEASKMMRDLRKERNSASFQYELGQIDKAQLAETLDLVQEGEELVVTSYNRRWNEVVEGVAEQE